MKDTEATNGDMKCNAAAIAIIQKREGCKLQSYKDPGGIWTIGWGHTGPDVIPALTWSQNKADAQFAIDLRQRAEDPVNRLVDYELGFNQFSALCSFVYNIGQGNFARSSALMCLNRGDFEAVPAHMLLWDTDHAGNVLAGLTARRREEIALFEAWEEEEAEMVNSA